MTASRTPYAGTLTRARVPSSADSRGRAAAAPPLRGWLVCVLLAGVLASCATPVPSASTPTASAAAPTAIFLPRCPTSIRPQQELDLAGLPPLVPTGVTVQCLLVASASGTTYDAGYSAIIQLPDARQLMLYERRGGRPDKGGPSQVVREGSRQVAGTSWTWSVLANGITTLTATTPVAHVELGLGGDESQVDTLAAIAASLRTVESLPRPSAPTICAALAAGHVLGTTVAAAFSSSASSVARLVEAPPPSSGGSQATPAPRVSNSPWRAHPTNEPVAVCYLDGDFGQPRGPGPGPCGPGNQACATPAPVPNWDRVLYFVGVNRQAIDWRWGWKYSIPLQDPGP